jgi:hypothetical protein
MLADDAEKNKEGAPIVRNPEKGLPSPKGVSASAMYYECEIDGRARHARSKKLFD